MHTKNILDKKNLIVLAALAEGIKQTRSGTGPADLLDLAERLQALSKACDDRNTIEVNLNGMHFSYTNASVLVSKAAAKVEAEAIRRASSTLHLVEDLFTGHAAGTVVIGGIPNDIDGDTNEGADAEVFDRLAYKDVRPTGIKKYIGSIHIPVDRIPTGICDGTMLHCVTNEAPKPRWHTKVVRVGNYLPDAIVGKK